MALAFPSRLWLAIAGPNYRNIPSEGCLVYYSPVAHAMHGGFPPGDGYDALVCRVNQVQLLHTDDFQIQLRYNVRPEDINTVPLPTAIQPPLPIPDLGFVCNKLMTDADRNGNAFSIPARAMVVLFPLDRPLPRLVEDRVGFLEGDRLFLTRIGDGEVHLGVRRAAVAPINALVNAAHIEAAITAHGQGANFDINEFPRPGRRRCVMFLEDHIGLYPDDINV